MDPRPYRADLDGLRAVAILSILLCHYGASGFSGGFVGVDVFFVIAGYLLAGGIFREVRDGTWSYAAYYGRRARRVVPALLATLALSYIAAYFLLMPEDLAAFANAVQYASVGTSNLLYWTKVGYFSVAAADEPLLHTWSISAGVQVIAILPILMLPLLGRRATPVRIGLLMGLMALTSVLSVWAGQALLESDARGAFYLPQFRIAGLAAGALLVWLPRLPERLRPLEDRLLLTGLGLLIVAIVGYDRKTAFPGVALLLPILGAALCIYAGQAPRAGRLLRHPALVWIGLLSYSLYLVHWPVWGFARIYLLRPPAGWETPALVLASVGIAWIMLQVVERPFREAPRRRPHWRPLAFALACAGLAIGLPWTSTLIRDADGWPGRIRAEIRPAIAGLEFARRTRENGMRMGVCHLNMWVDRTALGSYVDDRCMYVDPRRPNYLIVGDSHGGDRYSGLSSLFPEVSFLQMTTASCRPLMDTDFMDYHCPERMQYVFRTFLPRTRLDGVILVGRWRPGDLDRLRATLKHVRALGHRVIVLGPAVEIQPWVPRLVFRHGRRAGLEEWVSRFVVPERREMDRRLRTLAIGEGAEYYSAIDAFCPDGRCRVLSPGGRLAIVDYGHQSAEGALIQAQGLKDLGLAFPRRQPIGPDDAAPAAAAPGPAH